MKKIFLSYFIIIITFLKVLPQQPILKLPKGHSENVEYIVISRDSKLIASGGLNKSVIVWDVKSGIPAWEINLAKGFVQNLFFSSDQKSLVFGSSEAVLPENVQYQSVNFSNGQVDKRLPFYASRDALLSNNGQNLMIKGLSYSKSASALSYYNNVTNKNISELSVWDINGNKLIGNYKYLDKEEIYSTFSGSEFEPMFLVDSSYFITVADESGAHRKTYVDNVNYVLQLWDLKKSVYNKTNQNDPLPQPLINIKVGSGITYVASSAFQPLIATAGENLIKIWKYDFTKQVTTKNINLLNTVNSVKGDIHHVEFSENGRLLVLSNIEKKYFVTIINLKNLLIDSHTALDTFTSSTKVRFAPNGAFFIVTRNKEVLVYSSSGTLINHLTNKVNNGYNAFFSTTNNQLITFHGGPLQDKNYNLADSMEYYDWLKMSRKLDPKFKNISKEGILQAYELYNASQGDPEEKKRRSNLRVWDFTNGKVINYVPRDILFSRDTFSTDKKYIAVRDSKSTGMKGLFLPQFLLMQDNLKQELTNNSGDTAFSDLNSTLKNFTDLLKDDKSYFNKEYGSDMKLINRKTLDTFRIISIDTSDWIIICKDGYYMGSSNGAKSLSYLWNNNIYLFSQFDVQYNRPDIVLSRIEMADTLTIKSFRKAYEKRLSRLKIDTSIFENYNMVNSLDTHEKRLFNVPYLQIKNGVDIPMTTKEKKLDLKVAAIDSLYFLDRLTLWINGVSIYGMAGISLREKKAHQIQQSFSVELGVGNNKIEISASNEKGVESFRESVNINYEPNTIPLSKFYFIGIGATLFKESSYNLTFPGKDIKDLQKLIKEKYPTAEIITLADEKVTKNNFLALKKVLLKTSVEDKVILSVAGHGVLDHSYNFYYATYDMDFSNPKEKGIRYEDLEELLDSIPARKRLLLIDACHSGEVDKDAVMLAANKDSALQTYSLNVKVVFDHFESGGNSLETKKLKSSFELMQELFADISRGSGSQVISAASGVGLAYEAGQWNNGVFTYCILKGLSDKEADLDHDNKITISELRNYVSKQVEQLTGGQQKPTVRRENIGFDWTLW